jgi:hypothetical protein
MCGDEIHSGAFVSRRDNKTQICGICAFFEGLYEREEWQSDFTQGAETKSALHEHLPL